jgi:hypothetical protein
MLAAAFAYMEDHVSLHLQMERNWFPYFLGQLLPQLPKYVIEKSHLQWCINAWFVIINLGPPVSISPCTVILALETMCDMVCIDCRPIPSTILFQ